MWHKRCARLSKKIGGRELTVDGVIVVGTVSYTYTQMRSRRTAPRIVASRHAQLAHWKLIRRIIDKKLVFHTKDIVSDSVGL
jgi:hypothetical protein